MMKSKRDQKSHALISVNMINLHFSFWETPSPDTPEVRAQIQRKIENDEAKKRGDKPKEPPKPPRKLFDDKGCPYNVNEGKYEFRMSDEDKQGIIVVEIKIPK